MTNTRTKQKERTLYIILAAALAARLLLALVTEGYTYDMSCFVAWGDKLASEGPAAFYSADYFADYPPGYILVLGLVSLVRKALQLSYESRWTYFLLARSPQSVIVPPWCCWTISAAGIWGRAGHSAAWCCLRRSAR